MLGCCFDGVEKRQDVLETGNAKNLSNAGIGIGDDQTTVGLRRQLERSQNLSQIARVEVFDVPQIEHQVLSSSIDLRLDDLLEGWAAAFDLDQIDLGLLAR